MVVVRPSTEALEGVLLICQKQKARAHCLLVIYMHKLGWGCCTGINSCSFPLPPNVGSIYCRLHRNRNKLLPTPGGSCNLLVIKDATVGDYPLAIYHHMLRSGFVCLDGHIYVALLNSCAKLKHLEQGLELHSHADRQGLLKADLFVTSALVNMYCKCGALNNAQQVFDLLPARNIVSWNALLAGYVDCGHGSLAIMLYEQLQMEGFSPNPVTCVCILKACGSIKDFEMGWILHADIERRGYGLVNKFVGSALIDMYVKFEMLTSARQVFDRLSVRDVVTWTTLIEGYVQNGEAENAFECLECMQIQGVCPNAFTIACGLKACNIVRDIQKIQEIHSETERMDLLKGNAHVVSVLVYVYGSCGFLARACEVFGRFPGQDVVAWTSLIAGHIEHGHAEEALKFYDQMQLEGVIVDAQAFACILKACGLSLSKKISRGIDIHSEIERRGLFGKDKIIGMALLEMYAMSGMLNRAKEMLDQFPIKEAILWNLLMEAHWEHGKSEDVLQCHCQMLLEGTLPDEVSLRFCVKASGSTHNFSIGAQMHVYIQMNGCLAKINSIGGILVDMYTKCGKFAKAQEMFDQLIVKDLLSWNALISGHIAQAHGNDALNCFAQMISEGIYPDEEAFVSSLYACGQSRNVYKGLEIHTEIERKMLVEQHPSIGAALVDMYFSCNLLIKAQETFEKLPCQSLSAWAFLLLGYADHGLEHEALKSFQQMQLEDIPIDAFMSKSISSWSESAGLEDIGAVMYSKIERTEIISIGLMLFEVFLTNGAFAEAQQMFDNLPIRNTMSWSTCIGVYATFGKGKRGLQAFDQMLMEGAIPDCDTFISSLKACGCSRDRERGHGFHAEIEKRGFQADLFIGSALVDMYARCGLLDTAWAVFDKLSARDVVSWNALSAGYVEFDYNQEALNLMAYMQLEKVSPSAPTLMYNLKACGNMGVVDKAREVHDVIEKQGLRENHVFVGNSLVDAYAKCGLVSSAQKVFDKLPVQDIASWNSLIFGYKQQGDSREVFRVFDQLIGGGLRPDPITYVLLLNCCSRTCLVDRSKKYLEDMITCYGINPMSEHHLCVVDLLCRAGHLSKAISLMESIPSSQKVVAWRTVLNACKNWGNFQKGKVAFHCA